MRRHKNQIQFQQVYNAEPTGETANFASLIKSAIGMFCVYLVFLVCYLPNFICFATITIYGQSIVLNRFLLFSCSLLSLNSSLNPVINCWKMKHIRYAINHEHTTERVSVQKSHISRNTWIIRPYYAMIQCCSYCLIAVSVESFPSGCSWGDKVDWF